MVCRLSDKVAQLVQLAGQQGNIKRLGYRVAPCVGQIVRRGQGTDYLPCGCPRSNGVGVTQQLGQFVVGLCHLVDDEELVETGEDKGLVEPRRLAAPARAGSPT